MGQRIRKWIPAPAGNSNTLLIFEHPGPLVVLYYISYCYSSRGTGFLSGHADGSIIRYYVADDSAVEQQVCAYVLY